MATKKKIDKSDIATKTAKTSEDKKELNVEVDTDIETKPKTKYKVKKDLDPNMIVPVHNGMNGTLVYKSRKTGEVFRWESFGDEQEMELAELKNAKNSYKKFFENNWFLIEDPEVIQYLGVEKYYANTLSLDGFDDLFDKSTDEIKEIVTNLPYGQKRTLTYRVKQLIEEEQIDSIKLIGILEYALGVELIVR